MIISRNQQFIVVLKIGLSENLRMFWVKSQLKNLFLTLDGTSLAFCKFSVILGTVIFYEHLTYWPYNLNETFTWRSYGVMAVTNVLCNFNLRSVSITSGRWLEIAKRLVITDIYFISIWLFFHEQWRFTGLQGKEEVGYVFDSSLPLTPASHMLRH